MSPDQLARVVRGLAPALQRAVFAALADYQRRASRASLAALSEAIARGDVESIVRTLVGPTVPVPAFPDAAVGYAAAVTPAALAAATRAESDVVRRAAEAVRDAYRAGAAALPPRPPAVVSLAAASFPPPPPITMTPGLPGPADAAARYAGDAVAYLRAEAAAGVRVAVAEGLAAGRGPRDVARGIRDVVGLGESQARWVANLRAELEAGDLTGAAARRLVKGPARQTLQAAIRAGRPLTAAQVDRLVGSYATAWRAWHAETVARTMALDLTRHGEYAAMRDAVRAGAYRGLEVTKVWMTTVDGRERDAHRALNGARVPLSATWNDDGVPRRVPGGFNCRCSVRYDARPSGV